MTFAEITSYIKDYSGIAIAIIGSVLAILTYRRAKETILQPIRTEVIKKQTDLLIELLELLGDESSLIEKVDYQGIIQLNILDSMLLCGSLFKNQEKIEELIKQESKGGLFTDEASDMFESIPVFNSSEDKKQEQKDTKRKFYDDAKKGKFKIPVLHLTKQRFIFEDKMRDMMRNPFLPKKIRLLVEELNTQISNNTIKFLKNAVEDVINEFFQKGLKEVPNAAGVFNKFNHKRISHKEIQSKLHEEIRKYLKIDSMP